MNKIISKTSKSESGYILVESLLSWIVLAVAGITFAILFSFGIESYSFITSRKEALSNARFAVNRMTQELLPIEPAGLISISPTQISFIDAAGSPADFHSVTVGGTTSLYRGTDLLGQNLTLFSFSYFDAGGLPITDYGNAAAVRRIQMDLSVKDLNSLGEVSVRGEVYPRNFYYSNFQ